MTRGGVRWPSHAPETQGARRRSKPQGSRRRTRLRHLDGRGGRASRGCHIRRSRGQAVRQRRVQRTARRGSCGASLSHRARNAGVPRPSVVTDTLVWLIPIAARGRGQAGARRSARPCFHGRGKERTAHGEDRASGFAQTSGAPGACQTTRAAERWLFGILRAGPHQRSDPLAGSGQGPSHRWERAFL